MNIYVERLLSIGFESEDLTANFVSSVVFEDELIFDVEAVNFQPTFQINVHEVFAEVYRKNVIFIKLCRDVKITTVVSYQNI